MQGDDKSLCLKSFPIKDEKGERSDLELEPPLSSILQILQPDLIIIDSQTLHSDGKFELPLGNKYLVDAQLIPLHPLLKAGFPGKSSPPRKTQTFMLRLVSSAWFAWLVALLENISLSKEKLTHFVVCCQITTDAMK